MRFLSCMIAARAIRCTRKFSTACVELLTIGCLLGLCLPLWASPAAERQRQAASLVSEALLREAYGLQSERSQLLNEALRLVPEYAPALWQLGQVRCRNEWIDADSVPEKMGKFPALAKYYRLRETTPDTLAGNMKLAAFCHEQKLGEPCRAHLSRILDFDSENAEARLKLGFRNVSGQWVSAEEWSAGEAQAARLKLSLEKWRKPLEEIVAQMQVTSQFRREAGVARLRKISDPIALPAMELVLSRKNEACAQVLVEVLSYFSGREATQALSRLAVFSEWESVRKHAAHRLSGRPLEEYVPDALASFSSPIRSRSELSPGSGGRLILQQVFIRETQTRNEVVAFQTAYRRDRAPGGNGSDTRARALGLVAREAATRTNDVQRQNDLIADLNSRLSTALAIATGQPSNQSPEEWWAWWNSHNEVFVAPGKGTNTRVITNEVALSDQLPVVASGTTVRASGGARAMDCLAAGTIVWTMTGPIAVEQIRVGDMTLSQNVETGELTYKPVLRTTVRPAGGLIRIEMATETLATSNGHLFFVSGSGWVKAREIRSGMEIHAYRGTQRVSQIEPRGEAETYNLEVADFHTYFAGQERLLCHDNTPRRPTSAMAPGLLAP